VVADDVIELLEMSNDDWWDCQVTNHKTKNSFVTADVWALHVADLWR
jgi:hypothetical protein